jgi:uncharacterized OsmC-like protein
MEQHKKIKTAFTRVSETLAKRPAFGLGTGVSKATIKNGLTCEIHEANWTLTADMPEQAGGNAAGPTPGVFGRAALGSCLAIGYMMRAAAKNIPVAGIEVEIQADYDDGALFGTSVDVPPGYLQIRYLVTIDSEAPEDTLMQLLDEADKHSPYLDVFKRSQTCLREVKITSQKNH